MHKPQDFDERKVDDDFSFAEEVSTEDIDRIEATVDDLPL